MNSEEKLKSMQSMSKDLIFQKEEVVAIIKSTILHQVKKLEIDTILAVCPGGLSVATILYNLIVSEQQNNLSTVNQVNVGFETVEVLYNSGINKFLPVINKISSTQFCNVLLVDSVINTGNTINVISSFISANKIYVCTLFNKSGTHFPYYICGKIVEKNVNIILDV